MVHSISDWLSGKSSLRRNSVSTPHSPNFKLTSHPDRLPITKLIVSTTQKGIVRFLQDQQISGRGIVAPSLRRLSDVLWIDQKLLQKKVCGGGATLGTATSLPVDHL